MGTDIFFKSWKKVVWKPRRHVLSIQAILECSKGFVWNHSQFFLKENVSSSSVIVSSFYWNNRENFMSFVFISLFVMPFRYRNRVSRYWYASFTRRLLNGLPSLLGYQFLGASGRTGNARRLVFLTIAHIFCRYFLYADMGLEVRKSFCGRSWSL